MKVPPTANMDGILSAEMNKGYLSAEMNKGYWPACDKFAITHFPSIQNLYGADYLTNVRLDWCAPLTMEFAKKAGLVVQRNGLILSYSSHFLPESGFEKHYRAMLLLSGIITRHKGTGQTYKETWEEPNKNMGSVAITFFTLSSGPIIPARICLSVYRAENLNNPFPRDSI